MAVRAQTASHGPEEELPVRDSRMTVSEDDTRLRGASKPRRFRRLVTVGGCLLLASALVAHMLGVFTRHASQYEALDAYMSAVASGDRDALNAAIVDSPRREALINRHAGKPMTPTSVTMKLSTPSDVWWSVEVRYELPGQPPNSEQLLIHPRDDATGPPLDYVVEPAP